MADATAILASFVVPPGARRLSAAPTVGKGVLKTPDPLPGTPDWWIRPSGGSRRARPRACSRGRPGTCRTGSRPQAAVPATGSGLGFRFWSQSASLPDIPGVLDSRELVITVVPDGDKTAIRVDAQVTWQPARPASEQVPAAAQAVTISMDLGLNQGGKEPPKPVTITDPAKVRALKALINGLALFPPGASSCPADFGDDLVLTFRAGPRTPALAVATVDFAGCDGVDLTIDGKSQPALAGPGTDSGPQILKVAGLPWKIPASLSRPD